MTNLPLISSGKGLQLAPRSSSTSVRANLLPESILQLKAAQRTKNNALVAVVAGVAVVLVGFAGALVATATAQGELDRVQATNADLSATQRSFSDVSAVLNDIDGIQSQLDRLFVNDVTSGALVASLRDVIPDGVTLSSLNVVLADGNAGAGDEANLGASGAVLDDSGLPIIGSLDFTGTAPDTVGLASLIDNIGALPGMTVPYIVSIRNKDTGGIEFTAQASVTDDLTSDRFSTEEDESE